LLEEVNERKQTEIALFDANNYLENLFNYANAPIIVWDPQFRITRFNHAFEYLTGRTEADVAGQPLEILFPPDFANSAMMLIRQTLTGQRWESVEIKILHIDQSVRTVLWNSATLFSPDGEMPVATIAQGQDISDRKIIEEKLQKLNATLEQKVAERTKQLLANNKELAFHLNEIEQFTYIASHDLQEPLRTLISFSKLLNGSYSANLTENQLKFLSFINDSATRMQNLVKGLMEYSMLGKEKVKTDVNCNKILEEVISDMSESISSSNATITIGNLPIINGYSTELRLLFQNLINNALKFGKKDVPPQIKISSERKSGDWLFSIQDNGIGIDIKDKDKIFVIFKRMHNRDEYEGSGIGLAHCKKIVELHGGSIWIESTPGIGSLFMFTIPIV
jgi:PAS domain S-box-containing protein